MKIYYLYGEPKKGQKKGHLKGCVVHYEDTGKIGYSLCHRLDKKKMTKKLALEIAYMRAAKCDIKRRDTDTTWVSFFPVKRHKPIRYVKERHGRNTLVPETIEDFIEEKGLL